MRALLGILLLAPLAAGCIGSEDNEDPDTTASDANTLVPAALEPVIQTLQGTALVSALTPLAHQAATEPVVADVQREGTVMTVNAAPERLWIELAWTSPSPTTMMRLMLDTPSDAEGELRTYINDASATSPICFEIPPENLAGTEGEWAFMVHNQAAVLVDFTATVTSVGGDVVLETDRYHMEVEDDSLERVDTDELPCEGAEED